MPIKNQRREFRVDRHALTSLIQAQAGSLHKALLEAVANGLDAGASQIKVDLSPSRVVIEDDGKGFKTMEEIESFFENFGFDHSQLDRTVGRFGVGRGQLFNFGKNLWTTHGFTMAVDHQNDGFGYDLGNAKKPHKGVRIEIDLYEPLGFSDLAAAETEFRRLVKFCTIPVILNGKAVQKDPAKMKWDAETEDAWFLFDDSYHMRVYSQGLFVQDLGAYKYGKGGLVVTKTGKALTQNMARNDLLASHCPVWKRVDKELKRLAGVHQDKAKKSNVLTEAMRASLAKDALHGTSEEARTTLYSVPLFTLSNGKHVRLSQLLSTGFVAKAPSNDPSADLLIQRKQALSINPGTLHRFGVDSVKQLRDALKTTVARHEKETKNQRYQGNDWQKQYELRRKITDAVDALSQCKFFEEVKDLPMRANITLTEVQSGEYTAEEKLVLGGVRKSLMAYLTHHVQTHLDHDEGRKRQPVPQRTLALASAEGFLACTDGHSKVWIERRFLKKCVDRGMSGFIDLAHTLVHELLHDIDTSTGHGHDMAFFEAFHNTTINGRVAELGLAEYRSFLRHGGRAPSRNIKEMEKVGLLEADDATERLDSMRNKGKHVSVEEVATQVEPVAASVSRPRRKSR